MQVVRPCEAFNVNYLHLAPLPDKPIKRVRVKKIGETREIMSFFLLNLWLDVFVCAILLMLTYKVAF